MTNSNFYSALDVRTMQTIASDMLKSAGLPSTKSKSINTVYRSKKYEFCEVNYIIIEDQSLVDNIDCTRSSKIVYSQITKPFAIEDIEHCIDPHIFSKILNCLSARYPNCIFALVKDYYEYANPNNYVSAECIDLKVSE